jgi:hypothetical protein
MSPLPELLVDERGRPIGSPDGYAVGFDSFSESARVIWAFPTNAPGGGMSRRYSPPWPPGDEGVVGIALDFVLPAIGGLPISAELTIDPLGDFLILTNPLTIAGRSVYATISGGVSGRDYQLRWTVTDGDGNIYQRTGLLLCAPTS